MKPPPVVRPTLVELENMSDDDVAALGMGPAYRLIKKEWADVSSGISDTIYDTNDFNPSEVWQRTFGDLLYIRAGRLFGAEVKTERKYTGNLFAETYSNAMPTQYERRGWLVTLTGAMSYINVFLDRMAVFYMKLPDLRKWLIDDERLRDFEMRLVRKSANGCQKNQTIGHLVPYEQLMVPPVSARCIQLVGDVWRDVPVEQLVNVRKHGFGFG